MAEAGGVPAPPTGDGRVSGRVVDEGGSPISGCQVSLSDGGTASQSKTSTTTDENGEFIIEDLATGRTYIVTISKGGRVTVQATITVKEGENTFSFETVLPYGDDVVDFILPLKPQLNTPTVEELQAKLSWARSGDRTLTFDKFYIYRSATPGVSLASTKIFETDDQFAVNYNDAIPEPGRWYYKVYQGFSFSENPNIKIRVASNEEQAYMPKYVQMATFAAPQPTSSPYPDEPYEMAVYEAKQDEKKFFVAEKGGSDSNGRIRVYDDNGQITDTWTTLNGEAFSPNGVDIDSAGNLFVVDAADYKIIVVDTTGAFVREITHADLNNRYLTDVKVFGDYVYVLSRSDTGSGSTGGIVHKFNKDGTFITQWGNGGSVAPLTKADVTTFNFAHPREIAIDSQGNVYVADEDNQKVYKFDPDGNSLSNWSLTVLLTEIERSFYGSGQGSFFNSSDLLFMEGYVVFGSGGFFFSQTKQEDVFLTVLIYDKNGKPVSWFPSFNPGSIRDVRFDSEGNAYVLERRISGGIRDKNGGSFGRITKWTLDLEMDE